MATTKVARYHRRSGMGLAVAKALAAEGSWQLHVIGINLERGIQAVKDLHPYATFHRADVFLYSELSAVFQAVFQRHNRLDFVFANAGITESSSFYAPLPEASSADEGPPEPDLRVLDVDLNGVIFTSYLASHYFRRSPDRGQGASLVITASCGSLYPSYYSPVYTAAKHGVVGFMRAIAPNYWQDGIRVNAICPGIVKTNLVGPEGWVAFPSHLFIAPETIAGAVQTLIHPGTDGLVDARGTFIPARQAYGLARGGNLGRQAVLPRTGWYARQSCRRRRWRIRIR